MQYASYTNGTNGYALHKITGAWSGRASGYFAADGTLKDAEQILPNGQSRNVRPNTPMWRAIQTAGRPYAQR